MQTIKIALFRLCLLLSIPIIIVGLTLLGWKHYPVITVCIWFGILVLVNLARKSREEEPYEDEDEDYHPARRRKIPNSVKAAAAVGSGVAGYKAGEKFASWLWK